MTDNQHEFDPQPRRADPEVVRPLNFTPLAIRALRKSNKEMSRIPQARSLVAWNEVLIDALEASSIYVAPTFGQYTDAIFTPSFGKQRLPEPFVAIEYQYPNPAPEVPLPDMAGIPEKTASRRIAVCLDIQRTERRSRLSLVGSMAHEYPGAFFYVTCIYAGDTNDDWTSPLGGLVIPYNVSEMKTYSPDDDLPLWTTRARAALIDAGKATEESKGWPCVPLSPDPELWRQIDAKHGEDGARTSVLLDVHDEMRLVLAFLSALNCSNVTVTEIPAPAELNQMRRHRGLELLRPTRALTVVEQQSASEPIHHLPIGRYRQTSGTTDEKPIWVADAAASGNSSLT